MTTVEDKRREKNPRFPVCVCVCVYMEMRERMLIDGLRFSAQL